MHKIENRDHWSNQPLVYSGTNIAKFTPVHIIDNVTTISTYRGFTLFLKYDATLWATGENNNGQFGNGFREGSSSPIKILDNVLSAKAGETHSIVIKKDHTVWCAGLNTNGQLGLGDNIRRLSFTEIILDN
jgi:alpha-tubulin suppressor-like RCC1 family protein